MEFFNATHKPAASLAGFLAALAFAFNLQSSVHAQPVDLIVNGSFETGDFSGWTVNMTGPPYIPWQVTGAGAGGGYGMEPTTPQAGDFDAWNGFDGAGPMGFTLDQVVTIPASSKAFLTWNQRIQWNFALVGTATLPRTLQVEALNPADDSVWQTIYSFTTKTVDIFPTGDTGWNVPTGDLTALAGRTVKIRFTETVPQEFTGPAQFELDAVSLLVAPNVSLQGPIARGPNGHFYQVIGDWVVPWDQANAAASGMSLCGKPGHLATITSKEESDFVNSLRADFVKANGGGTEFWVGGFQANKDLEPGGNWVWGNNEGPIAGVNSGPGFANWAPEEPNDCGGVEDHLAVGRFADDSRPDFNFDGSLWNDEGCAPLNIAGYLVEYDSSATVIIDGCDSGVSNKVVDAHFCTIMESVANCAATAKNHGQFVSCVASLTDQLVKAGLLTGKEKGAIQSCAARATIP